MSDLTSNLGLVKYDVDDKITPLGFNQNFDKIDSTIGELKTDFVIAQGIQDIWRYRRWNSGLYELWCKFTLSEMTLVLPTHRAISVTFPVPFKSIPFALVTSSSSRSATYYGNVDSGIRSLTTSSCEIQAGWDEALADLYINVYITGEV